MDDRDLFARKLRKLESLFTAGQPADAGNYLFVPKENRAYVRGTTVPVIGAPLGETGSGLHVPAAVVRGPAPIDLVREYLTADEVLTTTVGLADAIRWLKGLDREGVLITCAYVLARHEAIDADWQEIHLDLARRSFQEPYATRIANLVKSGRPLVAPQSLLTLAKLALHHSPVEGGKQNAGLILVALLAIQQDFVSRDEESEESDPAKAGAAFLRELIRIQSFTSQPSEMSLITRLELRWRELPARLIGHPEHVDLEGLFATATGTTMTDLTILGLALWARALQQPGVPFSRSYIDSLAWPRHRLDAALTLFAAVPDALAVQLDQDDKAFGATWSFDAFRQFPIIRLGEDRFVVLSPAMLMTRLFGWLPLWDLRSALKAAGASQLEQKVRGFFGAVCEEQALETVAAIVGDTPLARRLYRDDDLRRAFGRRKKTADAAIDYGDAWVVVEVSTRQLARPARVGGTADALTGELQKGIDEKAEQLDATIRELIADESRLTRVPRAVRRRYVAVLVVTEGFPLNPMTYMAIEERLRDNGLLADPLIGPLHILDQEELEIVEGVAETHGRSILQLLEAHEKGNLFRMPFKDWLLRESGLDALPTPPVSRRSSRKAGRLCSKRSATRRPRTHPRLPTHSPHRDTIW